MRLMTLNHVPGVTGDHIVTVDQESGQAGRDIFTVKVDGRAEMSSFDAHAAVRSALEKVFVR